MRSRLVNRRAVLKLAASAAAMLGGARAIARQPPAPTAAPRSRFLDVNGARLHVLEWGAATSPPLLLLHPAPLNARIWSRFGATMAKRFYVVAPDARGFGDSSWSAPYSNDGYVEDLHAIVSTLGLEGSILCGNSMGGTLAYRFASRYPEQVERLIVVDTGPGPKGDAVPPPAGGPPPLPPGPFLSPAQAAERIPKAFGPAFARAMVEYNLKIGAGGQWVWKHDHAGTAAAAALSARDSSKWERWRAVRCPTLVLRGELSLALSEGVAAEMLRENANATLAVVAGAGHFIPIENPDGFEQAVRGWLVRHA